MTAASARTRQNGFTLIELIFVIVIIGVLMVTSLGYYQKILDQAREAGLELLASQFAGAVAVVHLKWVVNGRPSSVAVETADIQVNVHGWPMGAKQSTVPASDNPCEQLWLALIYKPVDDSTLPGELDRRRYRAEKPTLDRCRYYLITPDSRQYFFDYWPATGRVRHTVVDN